MPDFELFASSVAWWGGVARRGSVALLTMTILASAIPVVARAQDDDAARLHFQAGASDFEAGRYESALASFQRAYDLSGRSALLYNIALCHEELGDSERAARFLRQFLEEVPDAPQRGALEARLRRLEAAAARQAELEEAARRAQAAEAEGESTGAGEGERVEDAEPEATEGRAIPSGAWIAFGGGAAALVVGVTLGSIGLARHNDFESSCAPTSTCNRSDVVRVERMGIVADVSFGLAVAGAATGLVLVLLDRRHDDDAEDADDATTVSVAPWASPTGFGLATRGSF